MAIESPKIVASGWGYIKILTSKGTDTYRDVKLYPGGCNGWDWNETGTHHDPGIQPADVKQIVDKGALFIFLSQGRNLRLKVMDETKKWLNAQNIPFSILPTTEVIEQYNKKRQDHLVGALIHTTC